MPHYLRACLSDQWELSPISGGLQMHGIFERTIAIGHMLDAMSCMAFLQEPELGKHSISIRWE